MLHRHKLTAVFAISLALQAGLTTFGASETIAAAADNTKYYRVYQNDNAIREFSTSTSAITYAKSFSYAHVEKITNRDWVWDNFPAYKVYENGISSASRDFTTLNEARQYAKTTRHAQIRDLESPGFTESTYPIYRMYQGDQTYPHWTFATLADAKKAAKAYSNIHIIDSNSNQWVWDNLTDAQKKSQRQAPARYSVLKDGEPLSDKSYSFLLDAIRIAVTKSGSTVVNTATKQVVYSNRPTYTVSQSGYTRGTYFSLYSAISFAQTLSNATVLKDDVPWWTNVPYLSVYQNDTLLQTFHNRKGAVQFAAQYKNAVVKTADNRSIWRNAKKLLYLGWNGTSRTQTVLDQVAQVQGLDFDSPSWFELKAADGSITDNSDAALISSLQSSGIKLTPLVSNQFDSKLTSAFLRDPAAQSKFTSTLVTKLAALKVAGVNIDFEGMAGSDRALYTEFIRSFTAAAHGAGLTVSIDLPRGDVLWDAKTAYDPGALAEIVDLIMIMAYDEHWKGSDEAGSVAGLTWVEEGVKQFLAYGVPRSKLMLGVPFYVREWRIDAAGKLIDSGALLMKNLTNLIQTTGATGTLDAASGQMKYTYRGQDGYTHVFWAETTDTLKARLDIAKKYDLAGIAAWRLGYEQSDVWDLLIQQK